MQHYNDYKALEAAYNTYMNEMFECMIDVWFDKQLKN